MSGIFGIAYPTPKDDLGQIMLRAAEHLSYRGHDSVGFATITGNGPVDLRKDAGPVTRVADRLSVARMGGDRGILQLRWATFAPPSYSNSEPHLDCDADLVGAHTGYVTNMHALRDRFIAHGHVIRGCDDGEVVVHAVEEAIASGLGTRGALGSALDRLEGDFSFVLMRRFDNKIVCLNAGSSLYLGIGRYFVCCCSDLAPIVELTPMCVPLNPGEMAEFDFRSYAIHDLKSGKDVEREPKESHLSVESASKGDFPHFMLKEIHEQAETSRALLKVLPASAAPKETVQRILAARRVILSGSGSSYHALLLGSYFFNQIAGFPAMPTAAGQTVPLLGRTIASDDLLILVSQSGETKDLLNVLDFMKAVPKCTTIAVVNNIGSSIALAADVVVPIVSHLEVSVPATKTFMNQAITFLYLAAALARAKSLELPAGLSESDLSTVTDLIGKTISACESDLSPIQQAVQGREDFYVLGYGLTHPIAQEGALKIKEVTFNHPEGMYSSEFKHGPLAVVEKDYPVLFISTTGHADVEMIVSEMNEVKSRLDRALLVSPPNDRLQKEADVHFALPLCPSPFIETLVAVIPLQMLAYRIAVARGHDPDEPRNLSKTLTTN
jgi:glucosamine--fructose-6-phosphate aminotransferase (isomerizing)